MLWGQKPTSGAVTAPSLFLGEFPTVGDLPTSPAIGSQAIVAGAFYVFNTTWEAVADSTYRGDFPSVAAALAGVTAPAPTEGDYITLNGTSVCFYDSALATFREVTNQFLKYWVESTGTYLGNPWSRFTPLSVSANADAVLSPKGTGALLAQVPDGTVTGGNARGTYAVDLQRNRTLATQVASGAYSIIGGGSQNSISGSNIAFSVISGGSANSITGIASVIAGGVNNVATDRAFIGGGHNHTTSNYGVIVGGYYNTAGSIAFVGGGWYNRATGNFSAVVGGGSNDGSNQAGANFASGTYSFIGCGRVNAVSGQNSSILNGSHHSVTGNYSVICGGGTGTAGQGNTINGVNCFMGNGVANTMSGYLNTILNGSGITLSTSTSVTVLGNYRVDPTQANTLTVTGSYDSVIHQGWAGGATTHSNLNACVFMANQGSASTTVVRGVSLANNNSPQTSSSFCSSLSNQFGSISTATFSTVQNSQSCTIGTATYSAVFNSESCSISHDCSTISNGKAVSTKTHHSQATGYAKEQRHIVDLMMEGDTLAGSTNTLLALPASGSTTKDAKSVLVPAPNSLIVGKLRVTVLETVSRTVSWWQDAEVQILRGASTPVITLGSRSASYGIPGLTINVVNSPSVSNGIEITLTTATAMNLRAKATFDFDYLLV